MTATQFISECMAITHELVDIQTTTYQQHAMELFPLFRQDVAIQQSVIARASVALSFHTFHLHT